MRKGRDKDHGGITEIGIESLVRFFPLNSISKRHLMFSKYFISKNAPATGPYNFIKIKFRPFGVVTNLLKENPSQVFQKI